MNDAIRHLKILHNNPFIFAPAFVAFYLGLGEKRNALLLAYLVLPMVLHATTQEYLRKANRRSSLRTMVKDSRRLCGMPELVEIHRGLSSVTLQYLFDEKRLILRPHLAIEIAGDVQRDVVSPPGVVKAAERFGRLVKPYDVPAVYRILGVAYL